MILTRWWLWDGSTDTPTPSGPLVQFTLDFDDVRTVSLDFVSDLLGIVQGVIEITLDFDHVRRFHLEANVSVTLEVELEPVNIASVDTFEVTLSKDEVAWTGLDSVTMIFLAPDRTTSFSRSMTLYDDPTAKWRYTTEVTDLLVPGYWRISITVVDAGVTKTYPYEIDLEVKNQPTAG